MKKGGRATGTRGPDGKNIIKTGGLFTNTAVPRFNGGSCWQQHLKVEWVDRWDGGASAVCAIGRGSPERSPTNAGGRAGKLGKPLTRPFILLQFPGEAGSVPAAV